MLAFFLIECSPVSLLAAERDSPGLAEHLFDHRDYYRAITEFERASFFAGDASLKRWAKYKIGESYRKSGRPEEAIPHLIGAARFGVGDQLTDSCVVSLARSYLELGSYGSARSILDSLSRGGTTRTALEGWSHLLEGDYGNARVLFHSAGRDSLAALAIALETLPTKSPLVAGAMSAVVPGTGQIYAGAYRQGLTSFLVHALLGYVAYSSVKDSRYFEAAAAIYTGFSRFYVGNIMSASSLVRTQNQRRVEALVREGRLRYGEDLE